MSKRIFVAGHRGRVGSAKVGGIHANDTYPAEFIYDNLMVECSVVHQPWKNGVQKLLFLVSSCITGCLPLAGRINR